MSWYPSMEVSTIGFDHSYLSNPNAGDAAATIGVTISVAYDYRSSGPNGIQLLVDGEPFGSELTVELVPPGSGIAPSGCCCGC